MVRDGTHAKHSLNCVTVMVRERFKIFCLNYNSAKHVAKGRPKVSKGHGSQATCWSKARIAN